MNLTLHHFRKEFRDLRWRWFAFIALLGLDLAVNMEWLFPLRMGDGPLELLSLLPFAWAIFAAGVLSGCPEDCPADERHFSGTRPVAMWHFWAVRVVVFVLLVLLPVVAQNAAYLALSGRPWADVLCGLTERGMVVLGLGAWFVPVQALWTRQESMGGWLLKVAVMAGCVEVLPLLTGWLDPPGRAFISPLESMIPAGLCLAVAMSLLVTAHLRMALSFAWRLSLTAIILTGVMLVGLYWPFIKYPQGEQRPELVRQHEKKLQITPKLVGDSIDASQWEEECYLRMPVEMKLDVPGLHTTLHTRRSSVVQAGREIGLQLTRDEEAPNHYSRALFFVDHTLASFFPPETLLINKKRSERYWDERPRWHYPGETNYVIGKVAPSVDESQPVRFETEFAAQWWQREVIADMACVPNEHRDHEDGYSWRLIGIDKHTLSGEARQGAFTIQVHQQRRTHWFRNECICYLLYSPQRRVAWLVPDVQEIHGVRGANAGWERSTMTLAWRDILNHADGEDAHVDPSQLRLMIFRGREIGTSSWTWRSPELRFRSQEWNPHSSFNFGYSSLYYRDQHAFRKRISTLKPISAASTDAEVRHHLYDVLRAAHLTVGLQTDAVNVALREAYLPLVQHHLQQVLRLPEDYAPHDEGVFASVVAEHLRDEHQSMVIDLLPQHPHLIEIVLKKGWAEAAKRVQAAVIAAGCPINHSHEYADLLLAWGDDASHEALLREFRGYYSRAVSELAKLPKWRPRVEEVIRAERGRHPLAMPGPGSGHWGISSAANLGDAHALDLCLRLMGNDPFPGSGSSDEIPPLPTLINTNGEHIWQSSDPVANTRRFRHRTSADFIYVPEKLAWRVKP
jgi:hypothetical protein